MQSDTLRQLQSQYELLLRDGDPASRASAWQTIVDMKVRKPLKLIISPSFQCIELIYYTMGLTRNSTSYR